MFTDDETDEEIIAWKKSRPPPESPDPDDVPNFARWWVNTAKTNGVPMNDDNFKKLEKHVVRVSKKKARAKTAFEQAQAKADLAKDRLNKLDRFVDDAEEIVDLHKKLLLERYGPSMGR